MTEFNPTQKTSSINSPGLKDFLKRKRNIIFVVALVAIGIAAAIVVVSLVNGSGDNQSASDQPATNVSSASQTLNSRLDNKKQTITLQRPNWFDYIKADSTPVKNEYVSQDSVSKTMGGKSALVIYAIYSKASNTNIDAQAIKDSLNTKSGDFQSVEDTLSINDFLTSEISHRYISGGSASDVKLSLDNPKVLSTSNSKINSWAFTFTASTTDPQSQKKQAISGELVFVLGQTKDNSYNTLSYIMLSAVDNVWQKNTQTWQSIIDSLRVTEK